MPVTARLSLVKRLPAGQGVSYGHEYVTPRDTVLGLVPLGYADGIPRSRRQRGPVLVGGERRRSPGGSAWTSSSSTSARSRRGAGDEVVLFGGADGEPTAQDWAEAAGHDQLRDRDADRPARAPGLRRRGTGELELRTA